MNLTPLASALSLATSPKSIKTFKSLSFSLVGSHESGNDFGTSSAEIVSFDKSADKLYVVNSLSQSIDVLSFDELGKPIKYGEIDLTSAQDNAGITLGATNSVVAKNDFVAIAIENSHKQSNGVIALYNSENLTLINTYPAGSLHYMVTMTEDGLKIIAANEGEPSGDYTNDPEGSVTIIDISLGTQMIYRW